jgi:hypothetical protein
LPLEKKGYNGVAGPNLGAAGHQKAANGVGVWQIGQVATKTFLLDMKKHASEEARALSTPG